MLTCDAVLATPEPPAFVYQEPPAFVYEPMPCPGWEQTDSMGQKHYTLPWGNCTGQVRHITVGPDGRVVSDWGGPPMVIDVPGSNGYGKIYVYGIRSMLEGKPAADRQPKTTVDKANGFFVYPFGAGQ